MAAGFAVSLLRRRSRGSVSGYVAPVPASGPQAVPPSTPGQTLHVVRLSDTAEQDAREAGDAGASGAEGDGAVLRIRLPGDTAVG